MLGEGCLVRRKQDLRAQIGKLVGQRNARFSRKRSVEVMEQQTSRHMPCSRSSKNHSQVQKLFRRLHPATVDRIFQPKQAKRPGDPPSISRGLIITGRHIQVVAQSKRERIGEEEWLVKRKGAKDGKKKEISPRLSLQYTNFQRVSLRAQCRLQSGTRRQ